MRRCLVLALMAAFGPAGPVGAESAIAYLGSFRWQEDYGYFGGMSSIDLGENGAFVATSDGGSLATGTLEREGPDQTITGVSGLTFKRMRATSGLPLTQRQTDAEGIALAPDGTIFVSFEAQHRVWSYPVAFGPARPLPLARDFAGMQNNSSLEALAIDAEGALYTLPERSGELTKPFPVYRYRDGTWDQPFALRRDGDFLAVGADFGPDGKFYLLERTNVLVAFASRVRRFTIEADQVTDEETVLQTGLGSHGNLEGIAVWRDTQGRTRLTMISDDNFKPYLSTEIVEYALTE